MDNARAIVSALLEDIDADLPSHKSEVRILPTSNPNRFDVTLLTGFKPIYVGTIVNQGRSWKPVETMPGVGRQLRTRLHFIGPDKESVAMTMIEILKPLWKRQITQHLISTMDEDLAGDISKEAAKAEKPESPEQAEAGNYRKGHISLQGFQIAIENAKGSTRSGTNKNGTPWKVTMPAHYGYIKGTEGKDKDHLDVYIGPKPDGFMVYVVNQRTFEGAFDEHKIMLGYHSKDEAIADYDAAFSGNLGPRLRQSVVSTTIEKFKEWIASGNHKVPFGGVAEALLENEDEFGFDFIKKLALRVTAGIPEGTEFHIGFSIGTSDQHMIEMRAADDAIDLDELLDPNGEIDGPTWWDAINAAIPVIERNVQEALGAVGINCRDEGHDSTGDLVGSAWVTSGSLGFQIVKEFAERDEPFSTGSGSIGRLGAEVPLSIYKGVPEQIAPFIDVDVSFFDLNHEAMGIGEAEEEELDMKQLAMRTKMRMPKVWGDLKVGDVLYTETGSFERIDGFKDGYGNNYQDSTGRMVYSSAPVKKVLYSEFSPAYAYGYFVQRLSSDPRHALLGAELVEVPDNSDEALWKMVEQDMFKDGRTTPEDLVADRAEHQARLAARTPEQLDAQRRYNQMMGRDEDDPR